MQHLKNFARNSVVAQSWQQLGVLITPERIKGVANPRREGAQRTNTLSSLFFCRGSPVGNGNHMVWSGEASRPCTGWEEARVTLEEQT